MKTSIHPKLYSDAKITCASCGTTFISSSTKDSITVEVCSHCHPFYTGEQRFLDSKGRVELFQKKQEAAKVHMAKRNEKKAKEKKQDQGVKSLRELLSEA